MYFAVAADFFRSASIEQLGEDHGPGGPAVILALLAAAKQAGNKGRIRTTAKALATDTHLTGPDQAREIVEHAVRLGTLEALELGERTIDVRFPRWDDWQPRAAAAEQKRRRRTEVKAVG